MSLGRRDSCQRHRREMAEGILACLAREEDSCYRERTSVCDATGEDAPSSVKFQGTDYPKGRNAARIERRNRSLHKGELRKPRLKKSWDDNPLRIVPLVELLVLRVVGPRLNLVQFQA